MREAVRIRRRGGEGEILNSRAEFNRCYIPRLVVEVEDEDKRKERMEQEEKYKEEIKEVLDSMELNWEERKAKEKELLDKNF